MSSPASSASPYRNENDALRERKASLEREAARLREEASGLEALRAREQEIASELASIDQRIGGAKRRLPTLDAVSIASPCSASWDEMLGNDQVRFCVSCEKNVFNLSAMPRAEAEELLEKQASGELCVRYYRRADGTMMTSDCPVGVKRKRRKKVALAIAGAGALAFGATTALVRGSACHTMGAVQGEVAFDPPTEAYPVVMGTAAVPPVAPPPAIDPPIKEPSGWRGGAAVIRNPGPPVRPPPPKGAIKAR